MCEPILDIKKEVVECWACGYEGEMSVTHFMDNDVEHAECFCNQCGSFIDIEG